MSIRTRDPLPEAAPTWEDYWAEVGNESWLCARELIELSSPVQGHFAQFIAWHDDPCMADVPGEPSWEPGVPDPEGWVWRELLLDWEGAARSADEWPCSSTERRLLDLVLSLVQPDEERDWNGDRWVAIGTRMMDARDLGNMGSWRDDVADILCRYIKGEPPRR
jgi:hypothetical protein